MALSIKFDTTVLVSPGRTRRRPARPQSVHLWQIAVLPPPLESSQILQPQSALASGGGRRRRRGARSIFINAPPLKRWEVHARGAYHRFDIFSGYLFFRSNTGPPLETDARWDSNPSLPHEPPSAFADGTWYLSAMFSDGLNDSGFLPIGPAGETYLRLDVSGGSSFSGPPNPPSDLRLELHAGGVVRIIGFYAQIDALRATQWAITFTTDGSTPGTPPAVSPDVTVTMPTSGIAVLAYDLPAQADGTTVKVRVQTRRAASPWIYSEGSTVLTATADSVGPTVPLDGELWPGPLPEDL